MSRVRMIAFFIVNALLGLLVLADFIMHAMDFGAPHEIHVVAHEAVSGAIIVSVISQIIAPRRAVAGAQALLVLFLGGWAGDALTLRFSGIGVILALGVVSAALHPARGEVFSFRGRLSWPLAVLTALGAGPLIAYALGQAANQRAGVEPVHALLGHWEWTATWALLMLLLGALAALRTPGSTLVVWLAGLGTALFGAASLIYPGEASALGALWAWLAVAGGVVFIATALWQARGA